MAHDRFAFDVFDPATVADPYPAYERLREDYPVYHNSEHEYWTVARYEDVQSINRDWKTFTYGRGVDIDGTGELLGAGNFLNADPPTHTSLRDVCRREFVPKRVRARIANEIDTEVERLVGDWAAGDRVDLAADLAWRLFPIINCSFLGLPRKDADWLGGLARRIAERRLGDPCVPPDAKRATDEFLQYLTTALIHCSHEDETLLSTIAHNMPLTQGSGMVLLLFLGGSENVAGLITLSLFHLERHGAQRREVAASPELIPEAVEELLRYDPPQQNFRRVATRMTELRGARIPAGAPVVLLYGSANRDPRSFEQPDELNVLRRGRHLAFGDGIHHCLGAPVARLEAASVLRAILSRFPSYEIPAEGLERLPNHASRGFTRLPATLA